MVLAARENEIYRRDAKLNHTLLTPAERERLLQVYNCFNAIGQYKHANRGELAIPTNTAVKVARSSTKSRATNQVGRKSKTWVKIWCSTVLEESTSCPTIHRSTYDLFYLYTNSTSISCRRRQDICHPILPSSNTRADQERCQGTEKATGALKCDIEA